MKGHLSHEDHFSATENSALAASTFQKTRLGQEAEGSRKRRKLAQASRHELMVVLALFPAHLEGSKNPDPNAGNERALCQAL